MGAKDEIYQTNLNTGSAVRELIDKRAEDFAAGSKRATERPSMLTISGDKCHRKERP
jgi:hypothetical protein